ncbi:MAG TPA: carotenoid oxygenase family protein [Kofleriaceae bacterium]|jgi:all-trans-8'-apo-beta-carotenal 15,15'-oxygenase
MVATSESLDALIWTRDLPREHGFEPLRVEGALPPALRGTLFRNGPGLFGQFGQRYSHPFEGDGQCTAIRITDGQALGASRITASTGLVEERAAGTLLYGLTAPWYRRMFAMLRGKQKNTANTSVMLWQGRLLALMEGAKPTELDPRDLATLGETDLDHTIVSAFSAHPHRVASRGAQYNFGLSYGRQTHLHLYELPDVGAARHLGAVELPGPTMLHDFIATDSHLVFFVSPVRVNVPRAVLGLGGFGKLFQWKPELGTEVIVVPIDRPTEVTRFQAEAFYQWHFANAFDRGDELVIDYVRYPSFATFRAIAVYGEQHEDARALGEGRLHRATLDLRAETLRSEQVSDRSCEFPTIAPGEQGREHAASYVALDNLRAIGSIDARGSVVACELPSGERASEPLYVAGHLVALCHTAERAFVGVWDAARIPDGPVAKIWLDHHVPITFHGTFAPA